MSMHIGRSFVGHPLEDDCPCPQEACGLVDTAKAVPTCEQHGAGMAKTLRQMHFEAQCPAVKADGYAARLQDAIFTRWFDGGVFA